MAACAATAAAARKECWFQGAAPGWPVLEEKSGMLLSLLLWNASHSGFTGTARGELRGGVTGALDEPARLTCNGGRPALELVLTVLFGVPDERPFNQGMSDSLAPG